MLKLLDFYARIVKKNIYGVESDESSSAASEEKLKGISDNIILITIVWKIFVCNYFIVKNV